MLLAVGLGPVAGDGDRLRATMAAVKLSFTWLGVRRTVAPVQRTTAARAFHAGRELLSAGKLILDTKNPACRARRSPAAPRLVGPSRQGEVHDVEPRKQTREDRRRAFLNTMHREAITALLHE
jgi:hypothetical protein